MSRPTLVQEIEHFLYTHMQNAPFKNQLRSIVAKWEEAYLARIEELERPELVEEFNRMVSEGGASKPCSCGVCYQCRTADNTSRRPWPEDDEDDRGNHFGSD